MCKTLELSTKNYANQEISQTAILENKPFCHMLENDNICTLLAMFL